MVLLLISFSFLKIIHVCLNIGSHLFFFLDQEPGRPEKDFGRFPVKTVVKNIYILFSRSELPVAEEGQEIMDLVDPSTPLPSWFTEDDLNQYATLYQKSGFATALQVPYRYRLLKGVKGKFLISFSIVMAFFFFFLLQSMVGRLWSK